MYFAHAVIMLSCRALVSKHSLALTTPIAAPHLLVHLTLLHAFNPELRNMGSDLSSIPNSMITQNAQSPM